MALHLCASCSRHVKTAEAACPFCGATAFAPVPRPKSRATRAAMVFGSAVMVSAAVACSDDVSPAALYGSFPSDAGTQGDAGTQRGDASMVPLYGLSDGGPAPTDAAADDAADAGQDASPVALYGAVPADAASD